MGVILPQSIINYVAFTFLALFSLNTYSWWSLGHKVVAHIAYQNLNVKAKNKVDALIIQFNSVHPEIDSLEQMAIWPDELHGKQNIFLYFHWHYITRPIYDINPPNNAQSRPRDKRVRNKTTIDTDNSVWALHQIINILQKNQAESLYEQARLFAFLIHITGDMHQPLHNATHISSLHPEGDRGGNEYFITYNGKSVNLHQVWDSGFGLFTGSESLHHVDELSRYITTKYPLSYFEAATIQNLSPASWSDEGVNHAIEYVYVTPENETTNRIYINNGKKLSEKEVALAGYRLAALLNQFWGMD